MQLSGAAHADPVAGFAAGHDFAVHVQRPAAHSQSVPSYRHTPAGAHGLRSAGATIGHVQDALLGLPGVHVHDCCSDGYPHV